MLASTTRTVNADWFNNVGPGVSQQTAMKTTLRKGGAADLNVYSVGYVFKFWISSNIPSINSPASPLDPELVFLATPHFQWIIPRNKRTMVSSSFSLRFRVVPPARTTHEAGHWAGLYHTFQGGCDGPGDYVDDTAPEASASYGCLAGRDTCTGGQVDPIRALFLL